MPVDFAPERWHGIREIYRKWWTGELERPLIQITLWGGDPGRPRPSTPLLEQKNVGDFSLEPEEIIDRWDWELSCQRYLGDAFPHFATHMYGPGVAAAFLGATLDTSTGQVWFLAPRAVEASDLHFQYDPDNIWLNRVKSICRAGVERWQGSVQVGMTDLGGAMDILHTFRPGEQLATDLYDAPEEVERLTWELHELWWRYFDEFNAILQPSNPGYTAWAPIFSDIPYYMLQCDFAYMIGPKHFARFVRPEIAASCRRLGNAFYHLDGKGQLPHLDLLLDISELKGVQWVPGAGQKPEPEWPEVYARILGAGRRTQFWGSFDSLDRLMQSLGTVKGICLCAGCDISRRDEAMRLLEKYSAL